MFQSFAEFFTGFVLGGSILGFWALVLAVVISFFVAESKDTGLIAFIAFAVFSVVTFYWSNFPWAQILTTRNIITYLVAGFLFAIIRTYFYGRRVYDKGYGKTALQDAISSLKYRIFRWWFLAPISLLHWIFSDLFVQLWDAIYQKVGVMFEKVLTAGFNSKKENNKENGETSNTTGTSQS